jgi:hypothetical protein
MAKVTASTAGRSIPLYCLVTDRTATIAVTWHLPRVRPGRPARAARRRR